MTSSSFSPSSHADLPARLREVDRMMEAGKHREAAEKLTEMMPECADSREEENDEMEAGMLSSVHLRMSRCLRGQGRTREAISECNSALQCRRGAKRPNQGWREAFLYRSSCFRSLHKELKEGGDKSDSEAVEKDRRDADIVVDAESKETEEEGKKKRIFKRLDEALSEAKHGESIFVEPGRYKVTSSSSSLPAAPFFLLGKNVSILGASASSCILEYPGRAGGASSSALETFLICGSSPDATTFIKRLTFRSVSASSSSSSPLRVSTRFLGVGAGRIHLEDCVFEGGGGGGGGAGDAADAVYASARICGHLASSYPSPVVTARFCIFDRCRSFAAFTAMTAEANVRNCLFLGSRISALSSASVAVEDCEFVQTTDDADDDSDDNPLQATLTATASHLAVRRCFVRGGDGVSSPSSSRQAVALTSGSRGEVADSLILRCGGGGVACAASDLACAGNILSDCATRLCSPAALMELLSLRGGVVENGGGGHGSGEVEKEETLGFCTGISVRETGGDRKVSVTGNLFVRCDVGLHSGKDSSPAVRANAFRGSFSAGVFAEFGAKPNIVDNEFAATARDSRQALSSSPSGLGVLLVLGSRGMVGRNIFSGFSVSPILCFASCRPLLTGNSFSGVQVDRRRQEAVEGRMRASFRRDLFEAKENGGGGDARFYIVDSEKCEKELRDVILRGEEEDKKSVKDTRE